MDDLFAALRERVVAATRTLVPDLPDGLAARIEVTPARDPAHGDMATNAAMIAAKHAGRKPADLASDLAASLAADGTLDATPAGPGFINFRLAPETLQAQLAVILAAGEAYGDSTEGAGHTVNVEYVSANPTGPLHVGHCRGAVVGDVIASLLEKTGHQVVREYYINDAGAQVAALAWSAYWRYLQALGTTLTEAEYSTSVPGGLQYGGDYLVPVGEALAREHGAALAAEGLRPAEPSLWFATVQNYTLARMLEAIREDLAALGIRQEVFTSERALLGSGAVDRALGTLKEQNLLYRGVLEPPKGKQPEDWEAREQLLFRATQFGDDTDRPLQKSSGENTYFANDIAYHADKLARGADRLIDIWGADHGGYVSRMKAAVRALAGEDRLEIVLCQIVHILRGGEPVRMSKRAGTFVTLRDLIDEVGRDAVRFTMLTRRADAQMSFDLDLVRAQTRDNPVFYVQYAHARCRSVLRLAGETFGHASVARESLRDAPVDVLSASEELALIRRLVAWPRTVEGAALAREPHRIAFFLYDLAGDFHMLWNRGRDEASLRFIQEDRPAETRARLALVESVATILRSGLRVLGVEPAEEMR